MDNSSYINIARQSGLLREMNVIANNIANVSTTGFRREGAVFSEYVVQAGSKNSPEILRENHKYTVSLGRLGAHFSDFSSGDLTRTGGSLDLAIDGDGFFLIGTPGGERLSRAGHFLTDRDGVLVTPEGNNVLDDAGSTIQLPPDAGLIAIGGDGTISAGGSPLGKIGIVSANPTLLSRVGDNLWQVRSDARDSYQPLENPKIMQGFLEGSNVKPIVEIARMIEVQRAYEGGQKLLDIEHERISKTVAAIRQAP